VSDLQQCNTSAAQPATEPTTSALDNFLQTHVIPPPTVPIDAPPEPPLSGHGHVTPANNGEQVGRRNSKRLAEKPTANLSSIARCQVVLMKKLDILPDNQQPQEEHKKRLMALFNDPMPSQAVAAVDDLLSDGLTRAV
jgi:hypothetical protein